MDRIDRIDVPDITNRSCTITAEVEIPPSGAEGVLLAIGSRFGGLTLYIQDGKLIYEYVFDELTRHVFASDTALPTGRRTTLSVVFTRTADRRGWCSLFIDDCQVASGELPKTWPVIGLTAGLDCGRDGGSGVSEAYRAPFAFTGTLERVVLSLGNDGQRDPVSEYRGAVGEE
jgi:hypothetical protein